MEKHAVKRNMKEDEQQFCARKQQNCKKTKTATNAKHAKKHKQQKVQKQCLETKCTNSKNIKKGKACNKVSNKCKT